MLHQNTIEKIGLNHGIRTFILLSIYFLAMKSIGLVHMVEFRIFNAFIMFYGCYSAVKASKVKLKDFNFLKGYGSGLLTAFVASSLFSFFGIVYLEFINTDFINQIREHDILGVYQNELIATAQIFIEGSASGFLFTHAAVMWFKENQHVVTEKVKS